MIHLSPHECNRFHAAIAQPVEDTHCKDESPKGSIATCEKKYNAAIAQPVERTHGKGEATGSIPVRGSRIYRFSGIFLYFALQIQQEIATNTAYLLVCDRI